MLEKESLANQKQFVRNKNVFLVSEILKNENPQGLVAQHQAYLYRMLKISMFEWNQSEPSAEIKKLKEKLTTFESFYHQSPSELATARFVDFQTPKEILTCEQLETEISKSLNKTFAFAFINQENDEIIQEFKTKVVDFYNFLIASRLVKKDYLLRLIYLFGSFNKDDDPAFKNANAFTTGAMYQGENIKTAMIGIDFSKEWTNTQEAETKFNSGQWVTPNFFSTFVHEMGHAIARLHGLPPDLKEILNLNIQDNNPNNNNGIAILKLQTHFKKLGKPIANIKERVYVENCYKILIRQLLNGVDLREASLLTLARISLMPGFYGRTPANKQDTVLAEWHAEGFAYWYMTVKEERNKIWEFWHNYFSNNFAT